MSPEALGWYASIFLWMFFTGLGVPPIPEEAGILYAAGLTALHPEMRWWIAWPLTSAGILCADIVLYTIGRRWGERLFEFRWVRWMLKADRRQRLEQKFHDHGVKLLIAARLMPPLRTGVFLIAGTIRYPFLRFLAADGGFAVLGVGVLFFCGTWLLKYVHYLSSTLLWVAVPVVIVYGLYRYFRYLQKREMRGEPVPPSIIDLALAPPEPRRFPGRPRRNWSRYRVSRHRGRPGKDATLIVWGSVRAATVRERVSLFPSEPRPLGSEFRSFRPSRDR